VIVPAIAPPTSRVDTVKVVLVDTAGTVTLEGTSSGSAADKATTAPPSGAAAVNDNVPPTWPPPTTLAAFSAIDASTPPPVTVIVGDSRVLPFIDAVTVAVPGPTPVRVNVAVAAPAATVTGLCTVTTAGLLLVSVTDDALVAATESVTVPCAVPPTPIVAALSVTADNALPLSGAVGELELLPHRTVDTAARKIIANAGHDVCRDFMSRSGINNGAMS
jgi:hypothetical protein